MDGPYSTEKLPEDLIDKIKDTFASESPGEIPEKLINLLEVYDRYKIDIAVTGESGAGKSSLINAFQGVRPDDDSAAPTGVVETTMQATLYLLPNLPQVRMWDLPGMGTPTFTSKSYTKTMNLHLYDIFMVVMSERVRENNMILIDAIIEQKKPFYAIRSKIDNEMRSQRRKRGFSEESALNQMKEDGEKYMKEKNVDNPVFLISAHEPLNYEMPKLLDTFRNELPQVRAELFSNFLEKILHGGWFTARYATQDARKTEKIPAEDITKLHNMHKDTGFGAVKVKAILEALNHFRTDVAVLGETGSGASSLVNALTGMKKEVYGAAMSSGYPGVRFWGMSGIEAIMDYSMYEMKQVLRGYDFCIIIVSDLQGPRHIQLANAISELKRNFFLVQTKVDCYLQAQGDFGCDDTEILDGLRAQNITELQRARLPELQIFLINSLDKSTLDFAVLESALTMELNTTRNIAFAHYVAKVLRQ
ncbi:uncharacterized protein irgq1 [Paramisgurnus dabryanus]|uniref:uncharacterized protein irgq1 n=1 Tax=Paramisgurnus dabryanus TaxID=90735 RepID=UPI0031F38BAA